MAEAGGVASSAPDAGLNGWAKYTDPETDAKFYYNKETDETTWQRPLGFATPRESDLVERGQASWAKYFDEASGREYYFNSVTNERSWLPPGQR